MRAFLSVCVAFVVLGMGAGESFADDARAEALRTVYNDIDFELEIKERPIGALNVLEVVNGSASILLGGMILALNEIPDLSVDRPNETTALLVGGGAVALGMGVWGLTWEEGDPYSFEARFSATMASSLAIVSGVVLAQEGQLFGGRAGESADLLRTTGVLGGGMLLQSIVFAVDERASARVSAAKLRKNREALDKSFVSPAQLDEFEADLKSGPSPGRRMLVTLPYLATGATLLSMELVSPSDDGFSRTMNLVTGGGVMAAWALAPFRDGYHDKFQRVQLSLMPGGVSVGGQF